MDVVIAVDDVLLAHQRPEQRQRGLDAVDDELVERALEPHQALGPGLAVHDQLADQRVVIGWDLVALISRGIHPDAEPPGRMIVQDPARRRPERDRVLGIDAALDRVAVKAHVLLLEQELGARRNPDLLENEVDVGDHLGYGMLDLNPGIHFDEIELPVLVQELDGAGAEIMQRPHCIRDFLADVVALRRIERRRGAFLEQLLMPSLQ